MTYRERREARAARLQEWADNCDDKAQAAEAAARQISDQIPFGQPILVGHHSEGHARRNADRIHNRTAKAYEHATKAGEMRSRAEGITRQLDQSIYSDDPDAIEQLERRIADLEAQRDRIKAYNASCRKGAPDLSLLDDKQREDLAGYVRHQVRSDLEATPKRGNAGGADMHWASCGCGWHKDCKTPEGAEAASNRHNRTKHTGGAVPFPSYGLSGLAANIRRNRHRLERLRGGDR